MTASNRTAAPPQLRLFEARETREMVLDRAFTHTHRVALDETSWVDHVSGWLSQNEVLLDVLTTEPKWEQRERWMFTKRVEEPRLTAEYASLADVQIPMLRAMGEALQARYGVTYDSIWLNLYRDHKDSTGWHADKLPSRKRESIVPVLSLGETRRFLIRRKEGGASRTFVVRGGDLVVMGGACQRDWVHAVPKENAAAGMRISVNFGSSSNLRPDAVEEI